MVHRFIRGTLLWFIDSNSATVYFRSSEVPCELKTTKTGTVNYTAQDTVLPSTYSYNVKFRRVRVTTAAVEEQRVLHNLCVCIFRVRYPACNAHAPYYHLWPAPALQHFSTLCHKRHDFSKNVTEHKICFEFLHKFCLKYLSF